MDPPAKSGDAADSTDQKRRSSSRSIKRKRFDDEIVEYSLGIPPAQVNRIGTRIRYQSNLATGSSSSSTPISESTAAPNSYAALKSPLSSSFDAAAPAKLSAGQSVNNANVPTVAASTIKSQAPNAQHPMQRTPLNITGYPTSTETATAGVTPKAIQSSGALISPGISLAAGTNASAVPSTGDKRRAPKAVSQSASIDTMLAAPVGGSVASVAELGQLPSGKRAKKPRTGQQVSTKDLGRWKPIDDLALILGVQQTNDLRMVHRGIKFSCTFTVQELQSRWYSLMYEETISRLAVAAMRNLHPEMVEAVQAKALYNTQEEDLLSTIKSTESPTLDTFQELLDQNALVFYSSRTPKALQTHWQLMKQYALLPDQQSQLLAGLAPTQSLASIGTSMQDCLAESTPVPSKLLTFAEAEDDLNDSELLAEQNTDQIELQNSLADRCNKREIRTLENELTRWTVLVDSLTGIGFMPEFDNQTLAVLRGRLVRYLMRSREISFGRTTKDHAVDVDLSLEGPAHKASRRQGTIKLRSNGDFFIVNEGRRPLFIDGSPMLQGNKGRLSNNAIIEMAGLRFIFLINSDLINAIRQESAKMNGPLS